MLIEVQKWLEHQQTKQTLIAIFDEAWTITTGKRCTSNRTEIDARHYSLTYEIPSYILTAYDWGRRCKSIH